MINSQPRLLKVIRRKGDRSRHWVWSEITKPIQRSAFKFVNWWHSRSYQLPSSGWRSTCLKVRRIRFYWVCSRTSNVSGWHLQRLPYGTSTATTFGGRTTTAKVSTTDSIVPSASIIRTFGCSSGRFNKNRQQQNCYISSWLQEDQYVAQRRRIAPWKTPGNTERTIWLWTNVCHWVLYRRQS